MENNQQQILSEIKTLMASVRNQLEELDAKLALWQQLADPQEAETPIELDFNIDFVPSGYAVASGADSTFPVAEEKSAVELVYEPVVDEPVAVESSVEEVTADEPVVVEAPVVEPAVAEAPVVEPPVAEAPIVEPAVEIVSEDPVVEDPVAEEPVVEELLVEEPVGVVPVPEELAVEVPVLEEPVIEESVVDELVVEEPTVEASVFDDVPSDENQVDDDLPFFDAPEELFQPEPVAPPVQKTTERPAVIDVMTEKHAWRTAMPGSPVKDVRSAIALMDRVLFINNLFGTDAMAFQDALNQINQMQTLDEAVEYLTTTHPEWDYNSQVVYSFMMAVRRKVN